MLEFLKRISERGKKIIIIILKTCSKVVIYLKKKGREVKARRDLDMLENLQIASPPTLKKKDNIKYIRITNYKQEKNK